MRFLRTNTACIVTVGPFLDASDGVTLETALTITNEKITLTADTDAGSAPTNILDNVTGATSGTANDLNYITGNDAGLMQLELAAADTNRLGRMFLTITDAANHVPVFHEFMVLPAMIYDAFILGTDVLDASMTQILGTAVSSPATGGILDVNLKNIANAAVSTSTAQLGVNTVNVGGTAQTGRDIGASVLISSGAGAGQLDVTSGVIKANLAQILGTALTETAGLIAAGFKKFFNVATPTGTVNSLPDAVAGAAGGVFIAGTNAATTVTTALTTTFAGNVTGSVGSVATGGIAAASFAASAITAAAVADGAIDAATFAAGAINAAAIADGAIDAATFATGAITATTFAAGAINAAVVADGAIDAATFAAGAINAAAIADGAIDAATFATGAITAGAIAADAITDAKVASDVTIASITGNVGGNVVGSVGSVAGNVTGSVGSVTGLAASDVKAQVVAALATDTYAEPGQGAPAATTTLAAKLNYLFKAWRNKSTQTATEYDLYADNGSTVDQKASFSDDATTATRGKIGTGA
jgi:hypothetical protein